MVLPAMYPEGKFLFFSRQSRQPVAEDTSTLLNNISNQSEDLKTALYAACVSGDLSEVKNLRKRGADIISPINDTGLRALHVAAMHNQVEIISYIVSKKRLELCEVDNQGFSAMFFAVLYHKNTKILDVMYQFGGMWIFDHRDNRGYTLLHYAVEMRSFQHIEYLINKKINPNKRNYDGKTALHLAREKGFEDIASFLLCNGASENINIHEAPPMHKAAAIGDVDGILFHEQNLPVDDFNFYGATPLHWAAFHGQLNAVRYLLSKGAWVDIKDNNGDTPLHYVVIRGDFVEVAECLIAAGALENLNESSEKSLLEKVIRFYRYQIFECLLSHHVKLNIKDPKGHTIFHTLFDIKMFEVLLGRSKINCSKEQNVARKLRNFSILGDMTAVKSNFLRQQLVKECMATKCEHNYSALLHIIHVLVKSNEKKTINKALKILLLFLDHVLEIENEVDNLFADTLKEAFISGRALLHLPTEELKITVESRDHFLERIENLRLNDTVKALFILYQCVNTKITPEVIQYYLRNSGLCHALLRFMEDELQVIESVIKDDLTSMGFTVYQNTIDLAESSFELLMERLFLIIEHLPPESQSFMDRIIKIALENLELIYDSVLKKSEMEILKHSYQEYFSQSFLSLESKEKITRKKQYILTMLMGVFSHEHAEEKIVTMLARRCGLDSKRLYVLRDRTQHHRVPYGRRFTM